MLRSGLAPVAGLSNGQLLGTSFGTVTVDPTSETRSSSETSFLQASIANNTLQIYQQSGASKILFNKAKRATGVIVDTAGTSFYLSAREEVIISAGVVCIPTSDGYVG